MKMNNYYNRLLKIGKLLLLIILVLPLSCNKDIVSSKNPYSVVKIDKNSYLKQAKVRYYTEIEGLGEKSNFIGIPDWENSFFPDNDDNKYFLIVPLKGYKVDVSYTKSMRKEGFRNLIFSRISEDKINVEIVELHPDNPKDFYLNTKNFSYNFTGYLLTYSLENNLIQGHHRDNGVADKFMKVPNTIFEKIN